MENEKKICTTLWLTGLPCSGKTTLARKLKVVLENHGQRVLHLDGDDLRNTVNCDLGFSPEDRKENLRRAAHISNLFRNTCDFVIASFVSPHEEHRLMVKQIIENFILIYVKCSPKECKKRDVKGMYAKAKKGKMTEFTGESALFEEPSDPDIIVDTENHSIEECIHHLLANIPIFSSSVTPNKP